jgi:hypothetical protein
MNKMTAVTAANPVLAKPLTLTPGTENSPSVAEVVVKQEQLDEQVECKQEPLDEEEQQQQQLGIDEDRRRKRRRNSGAAAATTAVTAAKIAPPASTTITTVASPGIVPCMNNGESDKIVTTGEAVAVETTLVNLGRVYGTIHEK